MKILIVHAHPEPKSFCSALKDTAYHHFIKEGHKVQVSDLYQMQFNPVGGPNDFKEEAHSEYFQYQREQLNAYENGSFAQDLKQEMDKFEWADVLIFNFPLWWFGVPAILKGWVDRVFAFGFSYGAGKGVYENGAFPNKKAFCCLTTGGPAASYTKETNRDIYAMLHQVHHGMFYFVGMQVVRPFIAWGPAKVGEADRKKYLDEYKEFLATLDQQEPIFENEG